MSTLKNCCNKQSVDVARDATSTVAADARAASRRSGDRGEENFIVTVLVCEVENTSFYGGTVLMVNVIRSNALCLFNTPGSAM